MNVFFTRQHTPTCWGKGVENGRVGILDTNMGFDSAPGQETSESIVARLPGF